MKELHARMDITSLIGKDAPYHHTSEVMKFIPTATNKISFNEVWRSILNPELLNFCNDSLNHGFTFLTDPYSLTQQNTNHCIRTCLHPLSIIIPRTDASDHQWGNKAITLTSTASIISSLEVLQRIIDAKIDQKLPNARIYWSRKRNAIKFECSHVHVKLALKFLVASCFNNHIKDSILKVWDHSEVPYYRQS